MVSDGSKIASYMNDSSSNFRNTGRKAVYAIIAVAWTISFTHGKFIPTANLLGSLGLALSYLFLDSLYFLISALFYKHILVTYFKPPKNEDFEYKNEKKRPTKQTKIWNHVGQVWLIVMSIMLLVSFIFMILEILSLKTN